jgi:rhodanese-related sulfurtransferase
MAIRQFVYLAVVSAALGLAVNFFSPNGIPLVGQYRELSGGEGIIVPPAAQPGDPPYIALDVAHLDFVGGHTIFIDAREEFEWRCGTIPGAICIPFEYLPAGDLAPYFDSAFEGASRDTRIIAFCSGEECDLSLHLARNLHALGYSNVNIFFGGSREWEKYGLDVERRDICGR